MVANLTLNDVDRRTTICHDFTLNQNPRSRKRDIWCVKKRNCVFFPLSRLKHIYNQCPDYIWTLRLNNIRDHSSAFQSWRRLQFKLIPSEASVSATPTIVSIKYSLRSSSIHTTVERLILFFRGDDCLKPNLLKWFRGLFVPTMLENALQMQLLLLIPLTSCLSTDATLKTQLHTFDMTFWVIFKSWWSYICFQPIPFLPIVRQFWL